MIENPSAVLFPTKMLVHEIVIIYNFGRAHKSVNTHNQTKFAKKQIEKKYDCLLLEAMKVVHFNLYIYLTYTL